MDINSYLRAFDVMQKDFEKTVSTFGIPFEEKESSPRILRGQASCEHCENQGASLWNGWISPACVACRTGEETATFFVSLACTKSCYFCFNPNQEDYEYFLSHTRNIVEELRQAHAAGAHFRYVAITGGEPCLHKPEVLDFIRGAKALYPSIHIRLYTSGDLLDEVFLEELRNARLDEIRFSIKPPEEDVDQEKVLECIALAVRYISDVMVEMPLIPGTQQEMKELLVHLDGLGIRGINLLEFCFPLCNAKAFLKQGFTLRKNPYKVLYNYWYAGGLPIAHSEAECLELLRFAQEEHLSLGVHYCSLDNKNTGQIFQQNKAFLFDKRFAQQYAFLDFDVKDFFLKAAKVFGDDIFLVQQKLEKLIQEEQPVIRQAEEQAKDLLYAHKDAFEERLAFDKEADSLSFPLSWAPLVKEQLPKVEIGVGYMVIESEGTTVSVKEIYFEAFE